LELVVENIVRSDELRKRVGNKATEFIIEMPRWCLKLKNGKFKFDILEKV
jgi:hypothetical protein